MARTHSSYTASPTRWRSPQHSPRRDTSEGGSQYEMDLDALGLNSTFESTELDDKHQPKVDVVETSDIEGPEDFTMNMTYWMTADLPLAQQIRSRKEAKTKMSEVRGDARAETSGAQETTGEGDRVVVEDFSEDGESEAGHEPASTTTHVNGTAKSRSSSKPPSEASMENDEKVRSYLSALPDSDLPGEVLASTPLRIPKQNMLQVPSPSPMRARSLQPTVEDYDTPRKPTQETVIHHPPERIIEIAQDSLQQQVANLQSRLQEQEHASRTRITELETLLAYTRSDLDTARSDSYKQQEQIRTLQQDNDRQRREMEESRASVDGRLKAQEEELHAKMQEFGEELRLQSLARLQSQREGFERQMRTLEEAKRTVDADVASSGEVLAHVKNELGQLRDSHEKELRELQDSHEQELQKVQRSDRPEENRNDPNATAVVTDLQRKLAALQARANALQADLEKATSDAQSAREEALSSRALHASSEGAAQSHKMRASELRSRVDLLESQLSSAKEELVHKDRQLEQQHDLEAQLQTLRLELDNAHSKHLANEHTASQYHQLESRLESLQSQLYSALDNVRAKDQDFLKQFEEQERLEQRLNAAQGRIESLDATVSSLRQQLADAHRGSAKARADAEHLEAQLEDANERLHDAHAEADRRVADMEKRLSKLRETKGELETRLNQLQNEHDDLKDDHEIQMETVRDNAEDAIRKAGSLLQQERTEKRRIATELKKTTQELEHLRAEAARKEDDEEDSSDEESSIVSSMHTDPKDAELENLRLLVRKQASSVKTLKSELSALRKETTRLKDLAATSNNETVADLESQLEALSRENEKLKADAETREQDFVAINKTMDERLAGVFSKALKERAKTVVSKRDGQWAEKVQGEREFLGKVLMREWGRQEVGVAREGERQGYRYKYVQRS
ncbi:hypothetical protein BU23DRAFT_559345 [Bimuria novae-zelandiae CBS 107.79]|uniref:Uncharacterized protein n=1 Tax=Bimuria novae-zelandiae CBS 107.79 TaxID=1447943 RepID=A0A6A5URB8_9PLEO|nr:hypothetical protein BU23DRAFT_559345 [Bimuria novae-zelandiae CBS 107.79]